MRSLTPSLALLLAATVVVPAAPSAPPACDPNSGLTLPEGFCAVVVARGLGTVRQVAVAPNGDLFASLEGGSGGVVALRDSNGDGQADIVKRFGDDGATGIALRDGYLWLAATWRIVRWPWSAGQLEPRGEPEVVVDGLPSGGHSAKTLAFLGGDSLIVNIGSATNSCQERDRAYRSPGHDPCGELDHRAGLWLFSSRRTGQRAGDGVRYATGLRNAEALAVEPLTHRLYAAPHGRDQLTQNWGFPESQGAELPAEELVQANPGDDFGWPYCYFDQLQGRRVLAPEYGGDGRRTTRCEDRKLPALGFPGHWGPMAIAFYAGNQFPQKYRGGAFIAFHGSWNRAPLPQQGYRVVFVPFADGKPGAAYETFATASSGPTDLRASGVAVGPDGSLYIVADGNQTIWRVMYRGQ
jgi:glucose/arabinose dehydrogenase